MQVIKSNRNVVVDTDDTLICWDISEFPEKEQIVVNFVNGPVTLVPHKKNINTLIKFWKLGYNIIVHSGSGYEWAETIVKALDLEKYVNAVMAKPLYYFDDKPAETWLNNRVYRDPKTGKAL